MKKEKSTGTNKQEQLKKGQDVAFFSMLLILALALLKAAVGYMFDSPLLVADAWHSGADILINLSSLVGLKIASQKKSRKFPYGLYRAETIACLLIGGVIVFIGLDMITLGRERLSFTPFHKGFPFFPVGAAMASCAVAVVLAVKQRAIGRAINSQALLATAREAFFDIFTSLFVLVGIVCVYAKIPYVEGSIIILIAVLILKLGIETAWKSILILMDADMDMDLKAQVKERLNPIHGVKDVSEVRIRQSGPFKIVNCIIKTTPSQTLYKSHEMADMAENILFNEFENIESVFIHVEPEKEKIETAVIPVQDQNGLESRLHKHFGRAPWFMILILDNGKIQIDSYLENRFVSEQVHVGLNVVKSIIDHKVNLLFVSSIGEISFHYLKNHYVDIFKIDEALAVKEIISLYYENRLSPMTRPGLPVQNF